MFFTVNKFEDKIYTLTDKIAEKANQEDLTKAVESFQTQLDALKQKIYKYKVGDIVILNQTHRPYLIKKLIDNDPKRLYIGCHVLFEDLDDLTNRNAWGCYSREKYNDDGLNFSVNNEDVHPFEGKIAYINELYNAWLEAKNKLKNVL